MPPCVAILSGMTDPEDILAALELGANAFIPKSIEPDHLNGALEQLAGLDREKELGWLRDTHQGCYVRASVAFPRGIRRKRSTRRRAEREI